MGILRGSVAVRLGAGSLGGNGRVALAVVTAIVALGALAGCGQSGGSGSGAASTARAQGPQASGPARVFESKEGRFKVTFPPGSSAPIETIKQQETPYGLLVAHISYVELGSEGWGVTWTDYPVVPNQGTKPERLASIQRAAADEERSSLLSESAGEKDGQPYRTWDSQLPPGGGLPVYKHTWATFVGERGYIVTVIVRSKDRLSAPSVKNFSDEVTFLPP